MFHCFVVFAEMRTGSNFLESNLNAMSGITCHGEAFNPYFIGYPNRSEMLGITEDEREADPLVLLDVIKSAPGVNGFRYFHDHDARVFDAILDDPRCAKIILTRNSADSYVSWKIARTTGQWKLTDATKRKAAKAHFDAVEFAEHLEAITSFHQQINRRLQVSGQTAYRVRYEDLGSLDVMNGLAAFLGAESGLDKLDKSLKVQNPAPLSDKVANFDEMRAALAARDLFELDHMPDFEPARNAAVQSYVAAAQSPLLYLPVKCGPTREVEAWMAALDGVKPDDLIVKMSQKSLRQWKRQHPVHRSFTVLRHPLLRAHHAYCAHILGYERPEFGAIRQFLIRRFDLPVGSDGPEEDYSKDDHRAGFETFLKFLKQNLRGQTSVRVDAAWCSQAQALQGFGQFALPDFVLREDEMATELPAIAGRLGASSDTKVPSRAAVGPFDLSDIYDDALEELSAQIYARDYLMFGFGRWK